MKGVHIARPVKAMFPEHLRTSGSRYYRTATIAGAKGCDEYAVGFRTPEQIAHWLLVHGPVRLRAMWLTHMHEPSRATGRIDVVGRKVRTVDALIVGFDSGEDYPFRVLTPFGSGFGQLGRVWISSAGLARLIKSGAWVDAPTRL